LLEISIVSEQQAEQSGGETGSLSTGPSVPNSSDALIDQVMASVQEARGVEAPGIAPVQEMAKADEQAGQPAAEMPKAELPKAEPFKVDVQAAEASKPDTSKHEMSKPETSQSEGPKSDGSKDETAKSDTPELEANKIEPVKIEPVKAELPLAPRELLIMSPRQGSWKSSQGSFERASFEKTNYEKGSFESRSAEPKMDKEAPPARSGGRRFVAMAAMLLLAVIAGAAGGAFATAGLSHFTQQAAVSPPNNTGALEASVARIDADIVALKSGLEQTTKSGLAQFNKTSDRLERIEKAQAEPSTKLARLSEAVDKLRAAAPAQAAAPVTVAAATPKDVTGTVSAPAGAQPLPMPQASSTAAGAPPKPEIARLPTVDGWVLRDAGRGSALIEGRTGLYEVFAGDPIPGIGRVEAIRKQDGHWVVVTPKGLIVAR
jgi:hypothetical protein